MINQKLFEAVRELANEKELSNEDIEDIIKISLQTAYKKDHPNGLCIVEANAENNSLVINDVKKVVEELPTEEIEHQEGEINYPLITLEEAKKIKARCKVGDIIKTSVNFADFSRSAIQATKSILMQNIKTKQRKQAYEHFSQLQGEMITAIVSNVLERGVMLDLGFNVQSFLPQSEVYDNEKLYIGDKIRVYISSVEEDTKGPKIRVSRKDKKLVERLLEKYIPEIKDGTIVIKGLARDPGDRSKVAVYSENPDVDAIGACVGEAGNRIKQIVSDLGGEKIDLYKWSEDPVELVSNSLQPASVTKVLEVNKEEKTSKVVVPDEHLSLAIGKQGQNVRLAVQSCGYKIDIMPTSEAFDQGLLITEDTRKK